MPDNASRRGAADLGMPLMILAFVVIGGFMFWLNGQAAEERAMRLVEEETPTEDTSAPSGVQTLAPADIQMDASPFEGQEVRLAATPVASMLGTQGFWLEMPNGNPFLVALTPELLAEGVTVEPGGSATVEGMMRAMNDSTLTAWTEAGTINEGDRIIAEFATHYIEATTVEAGGAAGGAAGNGG